MGGNLAQGAEGSGRQATPALRLRLPSNSGNEATLRTAKGAAEASLPGSLDHGQHFGQHLLLQGGVCRLRVLGLEDDLMGLLEEDLPHRCLHALAPCGQLGSAFEDLAPGTHGLQGERARDG